FALRDSLGAAVKALGLRAHEKGLELICKIDSEVPDAFVGDALRLRQALTNLVGNAIKFTSKGEVVIQVQALEDEGPALPAQEPASDRLADQDASAIVLHFQVRDS